MLIFWVSCEILMRTLLRYNLSTIRKQHTVRNDRCFCYIPTNRDNRKDTVSRVLSRSCEPNSLWLSENQYGDCLNQYRLYPAILVVQAVLVAQAVLVVLVVQAAHLPQRNHHRHDLL
jgi:hypothetical protein